MQDFTKGDFILGVAPLKEEGATACHAADVYFEISGDAVIMSLWPSRGLELHGVEIKVSRADWKREAADPAKAEAIAAYCDAGELASVIRAALKQ